MYHGIEATKTQMKVKTMVDISDVLFNRDVSQRVREVLYSIFEDHCEVSEYTKILKPSDTNNDQNGSQHSAIGGTDFTYVDATEDDINEAKSLGFYEYFSDYGGGYTGHYYEGDGNHFAAIVVDPPEYAISEYI